MPITRLPSTSRWAAVIGFSAAVRAGDLVMSAGMTAVAPDGSLVGGDDAYEQAREALRKVLAALGDAGARPEHVVQTRLYLVDADDCEEVGRAHGEVFFGARPAATMLVVDRLLDPRMRVEIEGVAYVGP